MKRRSYRGAANPNFKDVGWHVCNGCGVKFHSYVKTRKYCSSDCYNEQRKVVKICANCGKEFSGKVGKRKFCSQGCANEGVRVPFPKCAYCGQPKLRNERVKTCGSEECRKKHSLSTGRTVRKQCQNCKDWFISASSAGRKFCSYQCFLGSGGPIMAGRSAVRSRSAYGAKKDANHKQIVDALRKGGIGVIDTSHFGGGFPDLICGRGGINHLVEIKNPKTSYGRRGLNDLQQQFAENWRGEGIFILESVDDVASFINGRFSELKFVS